MKSKFSRKRNAVSEFDSTILQNIQNLRDLLHDKKNL